MAAKLKFRNARTRVLVRSMLAAMGTWAVAVGAHAAGLGNVLFSSNLNEPLNASIELRELDGLRVDDLLVSFASPEDFERANIEYAPALSNITIEVLVLDEESGRIFLQSDEPMVEPYLTFLLDVYWPSGRVQQEYTILFDLPLFSTGPASDPVAAPVAGSSTPAPDAGSQNGAQQESTSRVVSNPDSVLAFDAYDVDESSTVTNVPQPGGDEYVIQAGDTMMSIASRVRPNQSVTLNQTMVAIQRQNPAAFPSDNINLIRPMQVLRIPSEEQIRSITPEDATAEVSSQNRRFQGLEAEPLALNSTPVNAGNRGTRDELTIVTADDELQGSIPGSSNSGAGASNRAASLENKLLVAEETADRLRVEKEELQSRITELNNQLESMQNIIVLKDQLIADMQSEQQGNEPVLALEAPEAGAISEALASAPVVQDEPVEQQPVAPATPEPAPAQPSPTLLDTLMQNITYIGAGVGGLLVALLAGLAVYRRRREREEEEDSFDMAYYEEDSYDEEDSYEDEDTDYDDEPADEVTDEFDDVDEVQDDEDDYEETPVPPSRTGSMTKPESEDELYSILQMDEVEEELSQAGMAGKPHTNVRFGDGKDAPEPPPGAPSSFQAEVEEPQEREQVETLTDEDDEYTDDSEIEKADETKRREDLVIAEPERMVVEEDDDSGMVEWAGKTEPESVAGEEDETSDGKADIETIEFSLGKEALESEPETVAEDESDLADTLDDDEKSGPIRDFDFGNLTLGMGMLNNDDNGRRQVVSGPVGKEATSIDLAVAYEAMGDIEGAREMLQNVLAIGTDAEKEEARRLLEEWKDL